MLYSSSTSYAHVIANQPSVIELMHTLLHSLLKQLSSSHDVRTRLEQLHSAFGGIFHTHLHESAILLIGAESVWIARAFGLDYGLCDARIDLVQKAVEVDAG